jgi:hypothetical protein
MIFREKIGLITTLLFLLLMLLVLADQDFFVNTEKLDLFSVHRVNP